MNNRKRYVVLAALCVQAFCIGGIYAWSVFAVPLSEIRNWDYGLVTLAYSMYLLINSLMAIPSGWMIKHVPVKKIMICSSFMFGLGWLATGFAGNIPLLFICMGLCCGAGAGLRYNPAITTAVYWFPDKPGFASGLVLGCMGIAPLILAPVSNMLLARFNVLSAFRITGFFFFAASLLAALLTKGPEMAGADKESASLEDVFSENDYTWNRMMKTGRFYVLWVVFLGSCISGLMMIGHASAIGQEIAGITAGQAALLVGILAVANFSGRLIIGALSDKIGSIRSLLICLIINITDMLLLSQANGFLLFTAAIVVTGIAFGGIMAVYPSLISETFGASNLGLNYGIIFTAYGIAAIVGPMAVTMFRQSTGSYLLSFVFAGVCTALSLILTIGFALTRRKTKAGAPLPTKS